jgi:hypothetical protein
MSAFDDIRFDKNTTPPAAFDASESLFANGKAFFGRDGVCDMVSSVVSSYKREETVQAFVPGSVMAIFARSTPLDEIDHYAHIRQA